MLCLIGWLLLLGSFAITVMSNIISIQRAVYSCLTFLSLHMSNITCTSSYFMCLGGLRLDGMSFSVPVGQFHYTVGTSLPLCILLMCLFPLLPYQFVFCALHLRLVICEPHLFFQLGMMLYLSNLVILLFVFSLCFRPSLVGRRPVSRFQFDAGGLPVKGLIHPSCSAFSCVVWLGYSWCPLLVVLWTHICSRCRSLFPYYTYIIEAFISCPVCWHWVHRCPSDVPPRSFS